jgi:hypothetical protein
MTPAKKRRNAWLAALIVGAPLLWTVPTVWYLKVETHQKNATCQENLKTLNAAIKSFAEAHQNRLPNAQQWQAILQKQSTETLHCPADPNTEHTSSYAMNANLSGKNLNEIKNSRDVILVYETKAKSAAPFGGGQDMADIGKPATGQGRHNRIGYRFNYFLMADGAIRQAGTPEEKKPLHWKP